MSELSITQRLTVARRVSNPDVAVESTSDRAGREGEEHFQSLFRRDMGTSDKNFFFERRVRSARRQGMRREIDAIVVRGVRTRARGCVSVCSYAYARERICAGVSAYACLRMCV